MRRPSRGFTIVELLIVIVIIAILAAIMTVMYAGLQQQAKNRAKVSAVGQAAKLIKLYKAANDTYPRNTTGNWCLTQDNTCTGYSGTVTTTNNTLLIDNLKRYGVPPASGGDTVVSGGRYGIQYMYNTSFTLQGESNPLLLLFWLEGVNQTCSGLIGDMISVTDSPPANNFAPALRSSGNSGGKTRCYLMFPT